MDKKIKTENLRGHKIIFVSALRFLSTLILIFSAIVIYAQPNKQQKYDINDPRNPDCPCHQQQKIAEKEYRELMDRNGISNKNLFEREIKSGYVNRSNFKKYEVKSMHKKKQRKNSFLRMIKYRLSHRIRTGKIHPDYSACYKW
jgi:hypothetical protein